MSTSCDLILPCRDEGPALPRVLARVPRGLGVIVVDNASTDDTAAVAKRRGVTVVAEPQPGYGAAVHAGVDASTADLVAVMDADGSLDPHDLLPLVVAVDRGQTDLAAGRRRSAEPGAWPWHARVGNAVMLWRLRRRTGLRVHDVAPMRVCWRKMLRRLAVGDRRFGYPAELLWRAGRAGWIVREYDVTYRRRTDGTASKVSGSVTGSVRAGVDMLRVLR